MYVKKALTYEIKFNALKICWVRLNENSSNQNINSLNGALEGKA